MSRTFILWYENNEPTPIISKQEKYVVQSALELFGVFLDQLDKNPGTLLHLSHVSLQGKDYSYGLAHRLQTNEVIWLDTTKLTNIEYIDNLAQQLWNRAYIIERIIRNRQQLVK